MKNDVRSSRSRTWTRRGLAAIGILAGLVILIEVGLRLTGNSPGKPSSPRNGRAPSYLRLTEDPILRWELVPGYRRSIRKIRFTVNAAGMRGPEVAEDKGDRIRIAILGNSAHSRTREHQTFARKLEKRLQAVNPRFEVLAMGVDGYDTLQSVTALEKRGLPLAPDVVILCYRLTDIGIIPIDLKGADLAPAAGAPSGGGLRVWRWICETLKGGDAGSERSQPFGPGADPYGALFPPASPDYFLAAQFKRIAENQALYASASAESVKKAVVEKPGRLWLNQYLNLKNIGKLRYAFRKLEGMAQYGTFKVLIAVIPFFYEVDGRYLDEPAHRIIRHEAALRDFPCVDFLPRFRNAGFFEVSRDGVDLSLRGHTVLAAGLFRALGQFFFPELGRTADSQAASEPLEAK